MGQLGETKLPSAKFLWKQACPVTIVGPDIDISAGAGAAASAWLSPVRGWPWRKGEPRPTDRATAYFRLITHYHCGWREGWMWTQSDRGRDVLWMDPCQQQPPLIRLRRRAAFAYAYAYSSKDDRRRFGAPTHSLTEGPTPSSVRPSVLCKSRSGFPFPANAIHN